MRKALEPLREAGRDDGLDPGLEPLVAAACACAEGRLLPILARLSPLPPPMTRPLMSYCLWPTWLTELRESERGRPGRGSARREGGGEMGKIKR